MHEKNIRRIITNQLKKSFPNWNKMTRKSKKELTKQIMKEVVDKYDYSQALDIPIEERAASEVAQVGDVTLVPDGVACRHPAFDVTPATLVDAIYTERGVIRPKIGERPDVLLA